MHIGWYKKVRFCKENNLLNAPAQLRFLTVVLTGPKKTGFVILCSYTIFSCLRHFAKEMGMAVLT